MSSDYTVVMPVKADCAYLKEAVESILAQSLAPSRIMIVVNPTDLHDSPTAQLAADYQGGVELLAAPDVGMVSAINFGISITETEYVSFLDSDDLWLPDKQEMQIELLESNPPLDAVNCLATNFRDDPELGRIELRTANTVMFTAMTFRSTTFQRLGILDPTATHFNFLYRWVSQARKKGFSIASTERLGLLRRVHDQNSWVTENQTANSILMAELRSNFARNRQGGET